MEYIVETNQLTKQFGKEKAVDGVEIRIPKGEIYGFLGPNGAGKTTTIRMLLGLMRPSSGSVHLFGKDLKNNRIAILKRVGSLVENPSYYPHLTAYENLEAIRKIVDVPRARMKEVLKLVRLQDAANKKVKGFSLGMKQRLGIAAALLHQPELLILDEPTNGLDPSGIIEMRKLIKQLPEKYGITVVISSHLLSEVDQMATTVGVISKGKMIFQDSIEAMRRIAQASIHLRVNDPKAVHQALLVYGQKADIKENSVAIQTTADEEVASIVQYLVEQGFAIYRVEEEKRSLENIFLEMTKEEQIR
ncbi:ABC transporter ATP-binding protein [Gracilibacillus alcaliphilus]|uniref:ABC transporter ATP-binding protein n=1 Tax=Gracilibacillus alcaliphilus TaxID=1401441 RepID=UPI001959A0E1|nr:ABC transporter ATP-binding protein [Gracilibacillus alcaliphilus]MBM7675586.1 ABC-2 type transport system ATP-binding protein [Gracilibacillus alcaliphilus]